MERPIRALLNAERKTSTLMFGDGSFGEYYIRGAICWPRMTEELVGGKLVKDVRGHAVLGAQDLATGIVWIYEDTPFVVVDDIITDNKIEYEGLSGWFNRNWVKYFARKYFYQDDYELGKQYLLSIKRNGMIQPKPEMIEIPTTQDVNMNHSIWRFIKLQKLKLEKGGELIGRLNALKQDDKVIHPAIYALQLLLFGYERYPYKERIAA